MTEGYGLTRNLSLRTALLILIAGPVLVILVSLLIARGGRDTETELADRATRIESWFGTLLLEAQVIADGALKALEDEPDSEADRRWDAGTAWEGRLEGHGLLQHDLTYRRWSGSPSDPDPDFADRLRSDWSVHLDGVITRLIVRAGPDPSGRYLLASFVLDSDLARAAFPALVPRDLRRGIAIETAFSDSRATLDPPPSSDPTGGALNAPDGDRLGRFVLAPSPGRLEPARLRSAARALAVGLLFLLLGLLVDWSRAVRSLSGFAATVTVLVVGRGLLLALDLSGHLLPRELGTATAFGSVSWFGLLGSPGDFLLSGLTLYLIALAARGFARTLPRNPLTVALLGTAAAAASWLGFRWALVLAENSRMPLQVRRVFMEGDTRWVLLIGLLLALVAAAELWTITYRLGRRVERPSGWEGSLQVAATLLVLIAVCGIAMQRERDAAGLDRLRTELASLTLEQEHRRELALTDTLERAREMFVAERSAPPGNPNYLAYRAWSQSELFFGGFKSSLDFYGPGGDLLSYFSFDLPAIDETVSLEGLSGDVELIAEMLPGVGLELDLIHAELPIERDGEVVAVVVGHVLDAPENLPFLPWSKPYLAALGAQLPWELGSDDDGPQYVLYDEFGTVQLTTLPYPPGETPALRLAAERDEVVHVRAGDEPFAGAALADRGRLHLLLVSERGLIERTAATARLALLGIALFLLLRLLPTLIRPDGVILLLREFQQFYFRKLLGALLVSSVVPLLVLSSFLTQYVERRGDRDLIDTATQFVRVAQRVLEDYTALQFDEQATAGLDDGVLYWLRRVVGQEIHVYQNGTLLASSKRELFASGLLPLRLDGTVHDRVIEQGRPSLVKQTALGARTIPVAYAPIRSQDPHLELVVALPLVLEQREIAGAVGRIVDTILLTTLSLLFLLPLIAAPLARTVARPVRELVAATAKITEGDYETRLVPRTHDEVAELVGGFNSMAGALSRQRADLERRREYMARLLRHATTGVVSVDPGGKIVTYNPAAEELLTPLDARLRTGESLTEALESVTPLRPLARALAAPLTGSGEPREVDLDEGDRPRRFRLVRVSLPDPAGGSAGHLILLDDVTELMRSNQLAAWAEMARAIAHEIKNPLTPIQLSTEHLRRLLDDRGLLPSDALEACLDTVMKQVHSLRQIASEFSTYAKLPVLETRPADPVALMRSVIGPYRVGPPAGVLIEEDYPADERFRVAVDARVISRALVNLVENALQSMADGGTLTVAVGPGGDGTEVCLSVRDTGTGLAPEVRRRLFEPYFSTKSSGTGLGLAIVQRAVEAHHGRIDVDSREGVGTTMRVLLPKLAD